MTIIEDYIKHAPKEKQVMLTEIYQLIKETAPEVAEKYSYGMPTFYLKGNFVYFAPASYISVSTLHLLQLSNSVMT